jgi:hypothetical protein
MSSSSVKMCSVQMTQLTSYLEKYEIKQYEPLCAVWLFEELKNE